MRNTQGFPPDPGFPLSPLTTDVSVTEQPNKKDLLNFSKSLNSYWVRESNPYCKIENLEY